MKMFLLGALSIYLLSCIIAIVFDETRLVDIWDFGEWYFHLPFLPFIFVYCFIRDLPVKVHDSIVLAKLGLNPFGKFGQIDGADTETIKKLMDNAKNKSIEVYCRRKLAERGEDYDGKRNTSEHTLS